MFEPESGIECSYIGWYYYILVKDFDKAKHYYLKGIEKGNVNSMNQLACYYQNVTKDYNKMEEWYLKAHESGDPDSMSYLADHYQHIVKDYDKMKTYYLKSHESGSPDAMFSLANHYRQFEDYDEMIECYLLSNTAESMNSMGTYYHAILHNYEVAEYWYLMSVEKGGCQDYMELRNLGCCHKDGIKDFIKMEKISYNVYRENKNSSTPSRKILHI